MMFLLDRELQLVIFSFNKKIQIVSGFAAAFSRDSRYVILVAQYAVSNKTQCAGALTIFLVRARACQFRPRPGRRARSRWIYLNCEQCSTVFSSFFCPGTIEIEQNEPTRSRWRVAGRRFIRRGEKPNGESLRGTTGTETTSACVFLFCVFFFLFLPFRLFTSPSLRVCLNEPPPWEPLASMTTGFGRLRTTETMDRLRVDW